MRFSVLMSVYAKESPLFLKSALQSIWIHQTRKPSEIIIVKDGPLTDELEEVISDFAKIAPVVGVTLQQNMGLGIALAKGIEACSNEIIARMDSDDIAVPERFEKQLDFLFNNPEFSFISSNIAEFSFDTTDSKNTRVVPQENSDILKFAKSRNPMNHMAVVFKKSAILDVGNYLPFKGYEDYYLWVRMLIKGHKAANLSDNLVYARTGNNMLARRHGFIFFMQEIKLQKEFLRLGFISKFTFISNIIFRACPRLLPKIALSIVYKLIRK